MRRGDVAALFKARALKEGEEPLLEVGELFNVDTGPFCRFLELVFLFFMLLA